eukprot:m.25338 g.25338  ORF g.25338 m.25338 type:complete len:734 (-) comp4227_c0_seq1:59-2260(-)
MAAPALRAAVENCMRWEQTETAIFLAERLHSEEPTSANVHLLAQCHVRAGHFSRAYSLLKGQTSLDCRFLFARCCYLLDKLQEGELALTGALFPGSTTELRELNDSNGAAYALLGDICQRSSRPENAIECYRRSLEQNPFLWSSFVALCRLGARPNASDFFTPSATTLNRVVGAMETSISGSDTVARQTAACGDEHETDAPHTPVAPRVNVDTPDIAGTPQTSQAKGSALKTPQVSAGTPTTPGIGSFALAGSGAAVAVPSALGSPMPWSYTTPSPAGASFDTPDLPAHTPKEPTLAVRKSSRTTRSTRDSAPPVRRSMRIFTSSKKDKSRDPGRSKDDKDAKASKKQRHFGAADAAAAADTFAGDDVAPPSKLLLRTSSAVDSIGLRESVTAALVLLGKLGAGSAALSNFECNDAIELFSALPPSHLNTGWTYCQIGKAYFELAKYKEANWAFRMARRLEPYRTEGMEIYSTTLWHLRQESALSYLAHEVVAADRNAPESWCVVGNCFSLQKEHGAAVKSLERAVQLDPTFVYAHTLLGHEYISNEDFTKALECFRSAVHHDARHYNAWYGLGMIYYRQERYELAEYHFQKAVDINRGSPILLTYLGIVQHAQQKPEAALEQIDLAKDLDDTNPLVKFNRAMVLVALDRNEEALEELQALTVLAPKESAVYFLMGKIYRKLGQSDKALMHFSWSMDLDPKGNNNLVKDAINKHQPVDDDEALDEAPAPLPEI